MRLPCLRTAKLLSLAFCAAWPIVLLSGCSDGSSNDSSRDSSRTSQEQANQASVLLITIDTSRADAWSPLGADPAVTPFFSQLTQESLLYTQARTTTPTTLPAHASMLTGLYPNRHTARDNSLRRLPQSARTLAELASSQGLQTAAFVSSGVLDPSVGIAQGFEVYDHVSRSKSDPRSLHATERNAGQVLQATKQWLDQRNSSRGFFAWVHFFDPHYPYEPPATFFEQAQDNAYLGEGAYVDRALQELFGELRQRNLLERTTVLVIGDHGEGLGQHGESSHGVLCYDSTLRVPLLLRYPDGYRAGERSDEIVSVVDVFPTLLDALALPKLAPADVDGFSLYRTEVPKQRGVYFESYYAHFEFGWNPINGWVDRRGKYIHGVQPEFFATQQDPGEEQNLFEQTPATQLESYRSQIAALLARPALSDASETADASDNAGAAAGAKMDDQQLRELRQLGYGVGASRAQGELPQPEQSGYSYLEGQTSPRPDPRTRLGELEKTYRAMEWGQQGRLQAAIEQLREVLDENPLNSQARERLGSYLVAAERHQEAEPILRRLIESGYDTSTERNNLGFVLLKLERFEEALNQFQTAHQRDPQHPTVPLNLALTLRHLGRAQEAEAFDELSRQRIGTDSLQRTQAPE